MDIAEVFVIISRGKRETFYLREFLKARCTSDRGKWKLFFFLHEECESCTRQRVEQRVELHTATWQLGLKRASSSSLFHSACCPTSVMLLHLPAIPLMPFELPTPFEPRFRKREAKFVEFVILARGEGRAPSLVSLWNQSFSTIRIEIRFLLEPRLPFNNLSLSFS